MCLSTFAENGRLRYEAQFTLITLLSVFKDTYAHIGYPQNTTLPLHAHVINFSNFLNKYFLMVREEKLFFPMDNAVKFGCGNKGESKEITTKK